MFLYCSSKLSDDEPEVRNEKSQIPINGETIDSSKEAEQRRKIPSCLISSLIWSFYILTLLSSILNHHHYEMGSTRQNLELAKKNSAGFFVDKKKQILVVRWLLSSSRWHNWVKKNDDYCRNKQILQKNSSRKVIKKYFVAWAVKKSEFNSGIRSSSWTLWRISSIIFFRVEIQKFFCGVLCAEDVQNERWWWEPNQVSSKRKRNKIK